MSSDLESDSDQELFPIVYGANVSAFSYEDPLSVSGVLRAVVENDIAKVKALIAKGLSPNINDNLGNTPIHVAAMKCNEDIVGYLLALEELEVNARNFEGETALFKAVEEGHLSIVTRLIKAKCDLDLSNNEGSAPLHESVRDTRILQLLLENGADPDVVDCHGETALHEAVNVNCLEAVNMLLYFNADANISSVYGVTPFMRAIYLERSDIQELLLDYVSDFNAGTPIIALALTHDCSLLKAIIDRGGDVNYKCVHFNAFYLCCQNPDPVKFELVWKHFEYQKLYNCSSYLGHLVKTLPSDQLYAYLAIILASGNVEPLFENFDIPKKMFGYLTDESEISSNWWSITSQLVCLYLSHGYALRCSTICELYAHTGYSQLLWICLHMDISGGSFIPSVMSVLCHPSMSMNHFYSLLLHWIVNKNTSIQKYRGFFRLGSTKKNVEFGITDENKAFLTDMPSLKELGRNAARDYLVRTFKLDACKDYHFFIQYLPIPTTCKDILLFKKPIYK